MSSTAVFRLASLTLVAACAGTACQSRQATQPSAHEPGYKPTATIKELMLSVVDPSADVVWNAVTLRMTKQGLTETKPQSEEEWEKVRHGAVALMEAANLLMMPGRLVAPHDHKSAAPGVELETEEMEALIAKDRFAWDRRATALHDVMVSIVKAIDARDADKVFELGEQIEVACETCHKAYWYPNEVIPAFPTEVR